MKPRRTGSVTRALAGKKGKRTLIVTGQKPITNIKLNNGGTTTLYEIFATTPDGGYVEEALRSFTELDVGQVVEYEIEVYNHPRYGTSYTLTPPKKETARRLRELEEQMQELFGWAENQGFKPQRALGVIPEDAPPPPEAEPEPEPAEPTPTEAPDRPDLDERFGVGAPWTDEDLDRPPGEIE